MQSCSKSGTKVALTPGGVPKDLLNGATVFPPRCTGSGMDEATVARVFEPFFTTKEVGKGTGLGLATVYGIVRQSGGHIWVYSEVGRGTIFKIYFPSAEEKLAMPAGSEPEAVALHGREATTILLVEDDELMRSLTRQLLVEQGYQVVEASDGKSALESLEKYSGQIDLLLTDVVMKGISGPELVAHAASVSGCESDLYVRIHRRTDCRTRDSR